MKIPRLQSPLQMGNMPFAPHCIALQHSQTASTTSAQGPALTGDFTHYDLLLTEKRTDRDVRAHAK